MVPIAVVVVVFVASMSAVVGCSSGSANQPSTQPSTGDYYQPLSDLDRESRIGDGGVEDGGGVSDGGGGDPERVMPRVLVRRAPRSRGSLDGDAAGQVIYENVGQLEECHTSAGGVDAGRGVVYVLLDVTARGQVDGVLIGHSDIENTRFMECLERELGELAMPATSESSVVQAHLVFGARDQDEGREMLRAYRASRAAQSDESEEAVPLTEVRRSVQGCYERVFRGRGTEGGRMVLTLTVDDDGRIESVEITEDSLDGSLDSCIHTVVEKLRLELNEGMGSSVIYPVIISPGAQTEMPLPTDDVEPTSQEAEPGGR